MMIPEGTHEIPPGHIAAVITYLEMRRPPAAPSAELREGLSVRKADRPGLDWYRNLFREIGRDWLWWSRLRMGDAELAAIIHDPGVEVFALEENGGARGLLELDNRAWPDVELTFFGVVPELLGQGAGAGLMAFAIDHVWSRGAKRFWLHTCSLDHPRALGFYRKWGFHPYARGIEIAPDPRLTGDLPREAAPQIPLIEP